MTQEADNLAQQRMALKRIDEHARRWTTKNADGTETFGGCGPGYHFEGTANFGEHPFIHQPPDGFDAGIYTTDSVIQIPINLSVSKPTVCTKNGVVCDGGEEPYYSWVNDSFHWVDPALTHPDYQGSTDPSPQIATVRLLPYVIGALLAVALFGGLAVYIVTSGAWQTPEPVLTFVQPLKNHRWVK